MTNIFTKLNRFALLIPIALPVVLPLAITMVLASGCGSLERAPDKAQPDTRSQEMKSVLPVTAAKPRTGTGAILLVLDITNRGAAGISDSDCRWRMVDKESGKSFFVEMPASAFKKTTSAAFYSTLPSGRYATGRLGCGIKRVWDMDQIYTNGFQVEEGRVSYLGKLTFDFDGSFLREVKKASRLESAQALTSAQDVIPATAGPLVSGFTLKPIAPTMYQTSGTKEGFDIQATGLNNAAQLLQPLAENLKSCSNQESANDPLRLGHFEYTASYKQGKFIEFISKQEDGTFSDSFKTCVDQAAARFKVALKAPFDVRVKY